LAGLLFYVTASIVGGRGGESLLKGRLADESQSLNVTFLLVLTSCTLFPATMHLRNLLSQYAPEKSEDGRSTFLRNVYMFFRTPKTIFVFVTRSSETYIICTKLHGVISKKTVTYIIA